LKQFFLFLIFISSLYSDIFYQDDIDMEDALELYHDGAIIIDVRTPSEFIHTGHGFGHINIPILFQEYKLKPIKVFTNFSKMEIKKNRGLNSRKLYKIISRDNKNFFKNVLEITEGDLDTEIILLCHSGKRSKYAANLLAKKGFENIYNLNGGFLAWKRGSKLWSVD